MGFADIGFRVRISAELCEWIQAKAYAEHREFKWQMVHMLEQLKRQEEASDKEAAAGDKPA